MTDEPWAPDVVGLDGLREGATEGHGIWRPEALYDEEGLKRRRSAIWLTDDDGCSLMIDEADAAMLVDHLRDQRHD